MSIEKQVEVYSYALTVLSLSLKIKFPCKIYLEHGGESITTEVSSTSPNKFLFNQEVSLKNQSDKEYIEVIVQLVTEKGAKYVGGVLKFIESELIESEGQRIVVPIGKCLDSEALCEVRVDQVTTSRVVRKQSPKKRPPLRSQYQPEINIIWSGNKNKMNEGQTKSEYNFPLSINKNKYDSRGKDMTINSPGVGMKKPNRLLQIGGIDKEPALSMVGGPGMSALQFQVYKQGYNKLKQKYRKQAQNARSEMNKRLTLQSNENNLKLQLMRYKLKTEELQKSIADKNQKIKEFTESNSIFQKKQLDTKYLKEEVENKIYLLKNLEETIKTLTRDNSELKNLQNSRSQSEQQNIRNLKEEIDKLKRQMESREEELLREIKSKNELINKKQYEIHSKSEEVERAKCAIEDLEKSISNKTFEWQKIQQNDRSVAKTKQQELKDKISQLQNDKAALDQRIKQLQQGLQEKKSEILRIQYDKKVMLQNNESLQKENEELRVIKEKYVELVREHKMVGQERNQLEKSKDREGRFKENQIEELTQRLNTYSESSKKTIKELQEKLKSSQLKLIESDSQNELLKNQQEKAKRQNDVLTKEFAEIKNQLKQSKTESKEKEEKLLILANELSENKNKIKQGDYSTKLEFDKLRQQVEKFSKSLDEEKAKVAESTEIINRLQLESSKAKKEWQFKDQKATKQFGYAKEKITSLQAFKLDLQNQNTSCNLTITNFKASEKALNEKVQKMELDAIKYRQQIERSKKDIKVLQQKLQNSENNTKSKIKDLAEQQAVKEALDKKISDNETEISQLRNDLNKEISEKTRNQKIVEILQADLAKAKEEHTRLNATIASREKTEEELREQLKKQKEDYTKLDMKLSALRKEYEKFRDTIVDNLYSVFGAIPEGASTSSSIMKQSKANLVSDDKNKGKENSQILNILTSFGRDTRSNMIKVIEQLKASQRENEKLNSEFSTTVNKASTSEFEFNQNIVRLQEDISQLMEQKQNCENKYEEEVFLLEGRIREKQTAILDLSQQIEQLDFTLKNTRNDLDTYREQVAKKDASRNKQINELKEQIEYQINQINTLQASLQKSQEELDNSRNENDQKIDQISKLEKELYDTKESLQESQDDNGSLRRELKKSNESNEELNLELISQKQEVQKLKSAVEDEERKAGELRQFLSGLMKQKEEIIKKELEKSEQVLEFQTQIEELKHQNESLSDELKKIKKSEEESKDSIKRLTKSLKEEQAAKAEQKAKNLKLSDKLKQKQKQLSSREETITKLQDKTRKDKDKLGKDVKQLEFELDETYLKLLNKQKQSNERINSLESENQKLKSECEKLREEIVVAEEALFTGNNRIEDLAENLAASEKKLVESLERIKSLEEKQSELEEQIHASEQQTYKLQGKIFGLEGKIEQKQHQANDRLQNLNSDWSSKYDSMCEQYEQRVETVEKEKGFLKERMEQKERQIKKLAGEIKQQDNNITITKKSYEEKIKSLESDRLTVLSQKNTENQRLVQQGRVHFDSLKTKQSECRRITSELQIAKASNAKLQAKLKDSEEKNRNLNRICVTEVEQMKRKEQNFKKVKENVVSSIWKSEREVRRVIQGSIKKIIDVVDEQSTMKVMEITKTLEQNVVAAISIKVDDKQQ